jgi:hypothetical protein
MKFCFKKIVFFFIRGIFLLLARGLQIVGDGPVRALRMKVWLKLKCIYFLKINE